MNGRNAMSTPREQLAELLKSSRLEAGYSSHAALAAVMNVSRPVISKAESASNPVPSDPVLVAWSGHTGVALDRLTELANRAKSGTPDWFVAYRQAEAEATMLRCWGPLIMPGVVQIKTYAYEVLRALPFSPSKLDELVAVRMERQSILDRAVVVVLIDASVLDRMMGSAEVMASQVGHLIELAQRPNISIHVVPFGANHGSWGGFSVATRNGMNTISFTTGCDDVTTTATDRADQAIQAYERVLGHALNVADSLDCLRQSEGKWKDQI